MQVIGHAPALPPHTKGTQLGMPLAPAGRYVQVPFALAPRPWAHTSQPPVQAALQQKPSLQKPERHWLAVVQAVPWTNLAAHSMFEQK